MRLLIVSANQEQKPDPVVPLGACFVAAAARQAGHAVRVCDLCFAGERWPALLARAIAEFEPQAVGLSLRNVDDVAWPMATSYLDHYRAVASAVKTATRAPLILGGSAFTLFPDEFMRELGADFGIAGEGEIEIVRLLDDLAHGRRAASLRSAFPAPHGPAQSPALDLVDLDRYYRLGGALNVQTRRGCAFSCSYCTYPRLEGPSARPRDVRRCVDDLVELFCTRGYDHFFVVDNTFNVPADHALAFCRELAGRKIPVRWTAYVTPAQLRREVVEAMAEAGCTSVDLGTESAHEATLAGLGKSFSPTDISQACTWFREANIRYSHSLILGGPNETPQTLTETVARINETRPSAVVAMLGVRVYPDTQLAHAAQAEGLLTGERLGLQPVFYISEAVRESLVEFASGVREAHPNWYFPGLEGDRWQRLWRRQRVHGARGPLWALGGFTTGSQGAACPDITR